MHLFNKLFIGAINYSYSAMNFATITYDIYSSVSLKKNSEYIEIENK